MDLNKDIIPPVLRREGVVGGIFLALIGFGSAAIGVYESDWDTGKRVGYVLSGLICGIAFLWNGLKQPKTENCNGPNGKLLAKIAETQLPQAYLNSEHGAYVDARMSKLTVQQNRRINMLWQEWGIWSDAQSFVRIMEHVAKSEL